MRKKSTPNEIIDCGNYYEIIIYNRYCKEIARTKVDKEFIDILKQHKWFISSCYVGTMNNRKVLFLHQYLIGDRKGFFIDHKNRNKLDNRIKNLRHITPSKNAFNRKGVKGISFNKREKKWKPHLSVNNKRINFKCCENKEEAIKIRKEAELKYFGENNTI